MRPYFSYVVGSSVMSIEHLYLSGFYSLTPLSYINYTKIAHPIRNLSLPLF